jgi:DNA repair protein RecN (Recombination protein N)
VANPDGPVAGPAKNTGITVLRELSVQNLALIEDARVELQAGYCAWTGETGTGKSLLLAALGLVLGDKAAADLVRAGKDEARAAAVFDLADPGLRADVEAILGGPVEDDALILTRRISAAGRSQAHANGLPVTVGTLRQLGHRLIDVHGQHEGRALLDPDRQRALLDAYGGLDPVLATYRQARSAHDALRRRRLALIEAADRRERERALLAFERDELAAADPRPGEHDELAREAQALANVEQIRAATAEGYQLLYEADHSAQELLQRVARSLEPLADSVPELAAAAADLERLADEAREVAYTLRDLGRDRDDDPERLEEVEARLALYRRLASRFRCAPDELADRRARVEAQLAEIDRDEEDLKGLDAPLARSWEDLKSAATALSEGRRKVCKSFAKAVQGQFKALSLAEARLSVEVESAPLGDDPTAAPPPEDGADRVEIVFAPNPGEPPRPLRKIASGGELSRVTLAIKTVLADVDRVPTLVFDEIDTGVGGRLGAVLGRKLAELARHHQVICVTHLPQMASFAAHQWVVRKHVTRGRTHTAIIPLDEEDRVEELAAMLRGDSAAEGTRQEALAMLVEARSAR